MMGTPQGSHGKKAFFPGRQPTPWETYLPGLPTLRGSYRDWGASPSPSPWFSCWFPSGGPAR